MSAPAGQASEFLGLAEHALAKHYLPRITGCLDELSEEDIWWRPNPASNSAGNLVLHLAGNMRQWITSGLGGAPDIRNRDVEFSEKGPIGSRLLAAILAKEVSAACLIIRKLTPAELQAGYTIQKYRRVTGMDAVQRVVEHFAYHAGQIIYLTKLRLGKDMGFTHLPGEKKPRRAGLPTR
ncbi:MAG: DUF1572 family protein [Terriglobia bacterium]